MPSSTSKGVPIKLEDLHDDLLTINQTLISGVDIDNHLNSNLQAVYHKLDTMNSNLIIINQNMNENNDRFNNSYDIQPGFHPIIIESLLCVLIGTQIMLFFLKVVKR